MQLLGGGPGVRLRKRQRLKKFKSVASGVTLVGASGGVLALSTKC
jgi:hypothetical protein